MDDKLEYAFNSYLNITQTFEFKKVRGAINWLNQLKKKGISHEIIGVVINEKVIYLLVRLKRTVECFGLPATQRCTIWCSAVNLQINPSEFLQW